MAVRSVIKFWEWLILRHELKTASCVMYEFVYKTDSFKCVIIIILQHMSEGFVLIVS